MWISAKWVDTLIYFLLKSKFLCRQLFFTSTYIEYNFIFYINIGFYLFTIKMGQHPYLLSQSYKRVTLQIYAQKFTFYSVT